ncbi:unnamed protein product [Didymodactylos carnosus]|uniref:YTH domain-containing protein n=1 Tax=Didymodactylos carnosus TaxID=1234261 RepID=A0A813UIZ9_9BILA|nr:unnamed protein product [Didymodactylos carnosus]CAF0826628.1 unnamed protein product [Didymodactylos carnosus]CAF3558600.1 unnamed protein product [Didymodactylos carnosus]CAF3613476.1 unnamed protein product [Didymodactylos carnosus]
MMPERSQQQTPTGAGMQFGYGHFDVISMQGLNDSYGYYQQPGLYPPFGFDDQPQWQPSDTQPQMPYFHPMYSPSMNEIPRSPFDYAPHYLTGHPPQYGHPGFPSTFPQTSFDMSWNPQATAFAQQQNQQLQQPLNTQQTQMNAGQGTASGSVGKKQSVYDEYLPDSIGVGLRGNTSGVGQNVDMLAQQMTSVDISEHHPHSLQQQHSKQLQDSFTLNVNEPNLTSTNHTNTNTNTIAKEHQLSNIGSDRNTITSASQQSSGGPKSYASVVSSDTNKILSNNSSNTTRQQQTSSSTTATTNQSQQNSSSNQTNVHDRNNLTANNAFGNESIRNSGAAGGRNNYSASVMSSNTENNYGPQQRGGGTSSGGYNSRNNQQGGGPHTLTWANNPASNSTNTIRGASGNGQSSNYYGNSNYYERSSNNNTAGGSSANNQYPKRAYSTTLGSTSSNNYQQQGQYSTGGGNRSSNVSNGGPSSSVQPITAANQEILDNLKRNHQYNPKDFNLSPKGARFFVIKSYSEDDVHRSIKYNIWCSTEHGNKRLDTAFREREGKGPLYLFFSVNASGHFCGMAEMMSPVDYDTKTDVWHMSNKWQGKFEVKWIYVKDVPNQQFRNIRLENNENKPVTNSRDTQEILYEKGKQMLKIMHFFRDKTSIFDDFQYYESKQAEETKKPVLLSGSNATIGNKRDTNNQNDNTNKNNTLSSFRKSNTSPGANKLSNRSTPSPAATTIQNNDVDELLKQKSSEDNIIYDDNEEEKTGQNNNEDNE